MSVALEDEVGQSWNNGTDKDGIIQFGVSSLL